MKRAIAYSRVSTRLQADQGISLDLQKTQLEAYCKLHGHELTELVVDDGISGCKSSRPGFQKILEYARSGKADLVVVYSLSRFARSTTDTLNAISEFENYGVKFASIQEQIDTSGPMGRFILTILSALAEMEAGIIRARTRSALQHKKARGERTGGIPFGYTVAADGITLVPDADESSIVDIIKASRNQKLKLREIVDVLNNKGLTNRSGTPWSIRSVHNILQRAA